MEKKKSVGVMALGILIAGTILINDCWFCSGEECALAQMPYVYYKEGNFTVGFLESIKENSRNYPISKMHGKDIYHFEIKSDIHPVRLYPFSLPAKMLSAGENIELKNFAGRLLFFIGRLAAYNRKILQKENPNMGVAPAIDFYVFEIEQMIPIEGNDSVLLLDVPENLSEEFEITVKVKNILPVKLVDTTLSINIPAGPFKIADVDVPKITYYDTSSYSRKMRKCRYDAGEEKKYIFKIKPQPYYKSAGISKTEIEISVAFGGYGIEEGTDKSKIMPLYSKKCLVVIGDVSL